MPLRLPASYSWSRSSTPRPRQLRRTPRRRCAWGTDGTAPTALSVRVRPLRRGAWSVIREAPRSTPLAASRLRCHRGRESIEHGGPRTANDGTRRGGCPSPHAPFFARSSALDVLASPLSGTLGERLPEEPATAFLSTRALLYGCPGFVYAPVPRTRAPRAAFTRPSYGGGRGPPTGPGRWWGRRAGRRRGGW